MVIVLGAGAIYWLSTSKPSVAQESAGTSIDSQMPAEGTGGTPEMIVSQETTESPATTQQPTVSSYSLAQVAVHNSASSCWSVINGGVYDLTTWIGQHPGGKQAIMGLCGKDGSTAFNGQHEGGEKQAAMLVTLKIGVLSQ